MTIMVDAGYLNPAGEIRGGAAELFFKHRDEIILEKVNAKDVESEAYDSLPREDFIRSRLEFPTFHLNWIDGILTSCLKILDFAGSVRDDYATPVLVGPPPIAGPIHDPMFVFEHVSKTAAAAGVIKPALAIADIIKYFAIPASPGLPWPGAVDLGIKDPAPDVAVNGPENIKTVAFKAALATITSAPKYEKRNPKDFIPLVPSDEFPNLDYGGSELSLQSKQELLFTAVVDALEDLINQIKATPSVLLFPISTGVNPAPSKPPTGQQQPGPGLAPIFTADKLILDTRLPDPSAAANDAITNIVNFEALKRWLIKPLYLTAIGIFFGSHAEGFTGLMGLEAPDAVAEFNKGFGDPKPSKLDTEITTDTFAGSGKTGNGGGKGILHRIAPKLIFNPDPIPTRKGDPSLGGLLTRYRAPQIALEDTSEEFRDALIEVAKNLNIDPNWLAACMALESAWSFNPHTIQDNVNNGASIETNPDDPGKTYVAGKGGESVGMIQIENFNMLPVKSSDSPDQARRKTSLGVTRKELLTQTAAEQMFFVEKFIRLATNNGSIQLRSANAVEMSINSPSTLLKNVADVNNGTLRNTASNLAQNIFDGGRSKGFIT